MFIALTNDDGIQAAGLRSMYAALRDAGHEVAVIAPVTEQSAVGHALTIALPLRVKEFKEQDFSGLGVYGTPTDCVKLGVSRLLGKKPDLFVSGINHGANVGPDVLYSGTVSAATEAAHLGFSALAVSHDSFKPGSMRGQAEHVARFIDAVKWQDLPKRCVLSLNYPDLPIEQTKSVAVCPQTSAIWQDDYMHREDPRGNSYWWITGIIPEEDIAPGTDRDLLSKGYITLTPLRFDFTDYSMLDKLNYLKA
jgi:5'-nucleotidase